MASPIDLQGAKIPLGSTTYPTLHDDMIDDIETGVNDGITTSNSAETLAQTAADGSFLATSTTSLTIANSVQRVFTLAETSRTYTVGSIVKATDDSNVANYMIGSVSAYSGTTLTVEVESIGGSGTISAWSITLAAGQGLNNLVEDTSPQLGGNLDINGHDIAGFSTDAEVALKLNLTGGTVTGQISGITPTSDANLARKDYVDLKLPLAGGVLTGAVAGITPTADAHLTRKDYVDDGDVYNSVTVITSANDLDSYLTDGLFSWANTVPSNAPTGADYNNMMVQNDASQVHQLVWGGSSGDSILATRRKDAGVRHVSERQPP